MAEVIQANFDSRPHLTGPCICFKCKHRWIGVRPVGTSEVICPECSCSGVGLGLVSHDGDHFRCNCGCFMYAITYKVGPYCIECGTPSVGWY